MKLIRVKLTGIYLILVNFLAIMKYVDVFVILSAVNLL